MLQRPHKIRALSKPKHIHKREHRHYWPYIPVILIVIATFVVSTAQPAHRRAGVLAYATSMSIDQLLVATNQQREQNNTTDLTLNQTLTAAAQAKANDMVARNYWSHNTPDGEEPWVFVNNAGYKYLKAGENLAYGFNTSNDTVIGWMNSPPHRENLLDKDFSDVGFGFANGSDYNNSGPETVVVAMYGKPQVLAASNQQAAASPAAPLPLTSAPSKTVNVTQQPAAAVATAENKPVSKSPVTTDQKITQEPQTLKVAKAQTLTDGKAPWLSFGVGLLTGFCLIVLLLKHAAGLRHIIRGSERFVLHHPLLDTILVSMVLIGAILSKTTGFIR